MHLKKWIETLPAKIPLILVLSISSTMGEAHFTLTFLSFVIDCGDKFIRRGVSCKTQCN